MSQSQLSIRIIYDILPEDLPIDTVIYCFAHNDINIPYIAQHIKLLSNIYPVYILENINNMSGVSECKSVEKLYNSFSIPIKFIPYDNNWINTKIESKAVIDWCIKNKIKNIIICAPIFHIVRAYMTMVSSQLDKGHNIDINIYAQSAPIDKWSNTTITHQGKSINSFNNFIRIELDRIDEYALKGDIKDPQTIWEYMMKREKTENNI